MRRTVERGFTLIELMLVVVIISALVAMVVPRLAGRSEEARKGIAEADIKGNLSTALKLYEVDSGRYPSSEQGLKALLEKPASPPTPRNWKGPYLEQPPLDPWKKPYVYHYPGAHPPREHERRLRAFVTRVLADADATGFTIDDVIAALRAHRQGGA